MNAVKNKRFIKLLVVVMLFISLILPSEMINNVAQAATKPSISATLTIGTGSIVGNFDYYSKDQKYVLSVSDAVKKATYSFTSSSTKIVTVKASGSNAYLTGLKAGTTTITCNQKLNGKTTKVGTCKVTVKNSSIYQDTVPVLPLGAGYLGEAIEFENRNNDATYTYTSDSKNFSLKENLTKFDGMLFIKHTFTASAPGTYTITIKETYNKSTRTVGKIKYTVKKATVFAESTIDLNGGEDAFDIINNYRIDVKYLFATGDKEIVEIYSEDGTVYLKGKKVGTTDLKVYENAKEPDDSKLIGTCKLTVKEVVLENLDLDFDETETYVNGDAIELEVSKDPYNALGTITVTSSNPEVATVSELDEDGLGTITPVSAGTTTITITCGNITKTQIITVSADEDEE